MQKVKACQTAFFLPTFVAAFTVLGVGVSAFLCLHSWN